MAGRPFAPSSYLHFVGMREGLTGDKRQGREARVVSAKTRKRRISE